MAEYAESPLDALSVQRVNALSDPFDGREAAPPYMLDGDVAIVSIDGLLLQRAVVLCGSEIIAGYDTIGAKLRSAFEDDAVGAVLLAIDSPGGECAGCAELASAMGEWSQSSGKPVEAYAGELAASAAYWLASSADKITVPRTGRVGSIGTVATMYNVAGAVAATGRRAIISASPSGKALGHKAVLTAASEEVDAAFKARMDRVTSELTAVFASHVAERRSMSVTDVLALDADVFMGSAAVEKRLADRVGGLSVALEATRSRIKKKEYSMSTTSPEQRAGAALLGTLKAGNLAGTTAEAKPEEIETAAKEATRLANLGREIETLTGQNGSGAVAMVKAWQEGHRSVSALENRVKTAELRGRYAMKQPPAAAFAVLPVDAKLSDGKTPHPSAGLPHPDAGPHPEFAGMSLAVFDARMDVAPVHPAAARPPAPSAEPSGGLTPAERAAARRQGLTDEEYLKGKASLGAIGFGG